MNERSHGDGMKGHKILGAEVCEGNKYRRRRLVLKHTTPSLAERL